MKCSVEDCLAHAASRNLCRKHYKRLLRNGSPTATKYNMDKKICIMENCIRIADGTHGYCTMHYKRVVRHGDAHQVLNVQNKGTVCWTPGCHKEAIAKHYCSQHYDSIFKHGREYLILAPDGTGYITKNGYREFTINGEKFLEHVMLAEKALGRKLPEKAVIHHMNRKPADNFTPLNIVICPDQAYHMLLHKRGKDLGFY